MKNKTINLIFIILILSMIPVKMLSHNYFQIYNNLLWTIVIIVVTLTSIYFTFKLKFIQLNIKKLISSFKNSNFDSLCVSLGAKIGVGSIAGIALAIYIAGPGVIFWLWISSILFSILTYCESYLGVIYQKGPFNYIKKGLKNEGLSLIYAIVLILSYVIGFIGIQANTVVKSIHQIINISPIIITFFLVIVISLTIFKSINKVLKFITKIVPIMCILYLLLGGIIIIFNIEKIPNIISQIINDALTLKTSLISIIIIGIQKSIFATESGIGTTSIASAIKKENPQKESLFQVSGVYFTSLIICTITAFIILTNNYQLHIENINGIELVMNIFNKNLGIIGNISLLIIIFLFALSTIISGYYYGINILEFIYKNITNTQITIFKILLVIIIFTGGIINSSFLWGIIDSFILYLLLINIYAIIKLRNKIK